MTFTCHGVVSGAFRGEGKGRPELRNGPLWRIFHNLMMLFFSFLITIHTAMDILNYPNCWILKKTCG